VLFGLAMLGLAAATLTDVRTAQAWSLLLGVVALVTLMKGVRFALASLPALGVAYLGFPMVSALLAAGSRGVLSLTHPSRLLVVKGVLALLLGLMVWLLRPRGASDASPRTPAPAAVNALLLLGVVGLLFHTYFNSQAASFDKITTVELSYVQGDWVATDNPVTDAALEVIGRERIISRRYERKGEAVDVIVTSTGADRRRAHPPEGCMTGAGWLIQSRVLTRVQVGDGSVPVTRFHFRKGDRAVEFYYWFSDGEAHYATYNEMLKADLLRRLQGSRTNWLLFRVLGPTDGKALQEFLSVLRPVITTQRPSARPA
jgi:EpsI family protein